MLVSFLTLRVQRYYLFVTETQLSVAVITSRSVRVMLMPSIFVSQPHLSFAEDLSNFAQFCDLSVTIETE
jgi:hypothetical protein